FDVSMQQVVFEGHIQRRGDLDADVQDLELIQTLLRIDPGIETATIGQFHDKIALPLQFVEGVYVDDVRVVQGSAGSRFPVETVQSDLIVFQLLAHQFYRHQALQYGVIRAIYLPLAAGSDFAAQLELPKLHRHHYQ